MCICNSSAGDAEEILVNQWALGSARDPILKWRPRKTPIHAHICAHTCTYHTHTFIFISCGTPQDKSQWSAACGKESMQVLPEDYHPWSGRHICKFVLWLASAKMAATVPCTDKTFLICPKWFLCLNCLYKQYDLYQTRFLLGVWHRLGIKGTYLASPTENQAVFLQSFHGSQHFICTITTLTAGGIKDAL